MQHLWRQIKTECLQRKLSNKKKFHCFLIKVILLNTNLQLQNTVKDIFLIISFMNQFTAHLFLLWFIL